MGCPPISRRLMRGTCRVLSCVESDAHHRPVCEEYQVKGVHMQPVRGDSVSWKDVKKSVNDTSLSASVMLYADERRTRPHLDWLKLLSRAQSCGGDVRVLFGGHVYTVVGASPVGWDGHHVHHWEVALSGGMEANDV